jgi:DNA-binding transcriptional LysR family regulator
MRFSLDQLRVLETIDRQGSFASAARELRRATSAISYSVRTLEERLGMSLFDRSGHRAALTPGGRVFLEEARLVLDSASHLDHLADQLDAGWEPRLEIVLDGMLPLAPVMSAVRDLATLEIPTRIRLRVEYLRGVRERFEADDATLMLAIEWPGDAGLVARPLPAVDMLLVAQRHHPLHALDAPLSRVDLARHVELVVADSSTAAPRPSHRLAMGSPHLFQLSDFQSKREALLAGVGFGWLPRHLATEPVASGELVLLPLASGHRATFQPALVQRRARRLGRAGPRFVDRLFEAAERA